MTEGTIKKNDLVQGVETGDVGRVVDRKVKERKIKVNLLDYEGEYWYDSEGFQKVAVIVNDKEEKKGVPSPIKRCKLCEQSLDAEEMASTFLELYLDAQAEREDLKRAADNFLKNYPVGMLLPSCLDKENNMAFFNQLESLHERTEKLRQAYLKSVGRKAVRPEESE